MGATFGGFITIDEFDLITPKEISVEKQGIMGIENQLGMMNVNLIIMEYGDGVSDCHGVNGGVHFVDHKRRSRTKSL
jgi:hypothetical protein